MSGQLSLLLLTAWSLFLAAGFILLIINRYLLNRIAQALNLKNSDDTISIILGAYVLYMLIVSLVDGVKRDDVIDVWLRCIFIAVNILIIIIDKAKQAPIALVSNMSTNKKFKLSAAEIKRLIPAMGGCIATDAITVDGEQIRFMYRNEPHNKQDSGWQFFSGTETQEYLNNAKNSAVYDVNTIANYDTAIIPYLDLPIGTELERVDGTDSFRIIPG